VPDLRSALRPLVDQPASAPPPLADVAARAGRRRAQRRTRAGVVVVLVVAGLAAVGVTAGGGDDRPGDVIRTDGPVADAPATTAPPDGRVGPGPGIGAGPTTTAAPPTTAADVPTPPAPTTVPTPPATTVAPPAAPTTVLPPDGPHEPFAGIEAEAHDDAGGPVAAGAAGGAAVDVGGGGWLAFHDVRFGDGLATHVEAVATPGPGAGDGAVLELRLDDVASPAFATITVPAGGGATTLSTFTSAAIGGDHDVYATVASPRSGTVVTLDSLRFVS